jgi:glycosyltransferase involved in cell wall biosynthesis
VDDGSSESTLEILKSYESEVLKVITQENRGPSSSRNRELANAQGDFIQWLDLDDFLAGDEIEVQLTNNSNSSDPRVSISSAWGCLL